MTPVEENMIVVVLAFACAAIFEFGYQLAHFLDDQRPKPT